MKEGKQKEETCQKFNKNKKKRIKKRDKFDFKSRYWIYNKKER